MGKLGNRKTRWGLGPAFFFGSLLSGPLAASGYQLFGGFSSTLVSEPEPIRATLKDWGQEFQGGGRQWGLARLEAGVRLDSGVELSLFARALADLRLNDEAAEFYGRISRKERLQPGEQVPVQVRVNGFTGHGLRLGYRYHYDAWRAGVGLSVFRANHLMAGTLDGQFTAIDDSDYNFDAEVDYVYYRDVIFGRPSVQEAAGLGAGLDMFLSGWVGESWYWSFRAEDLWARIHWEDAPYTVAEASTNQKSYDDNGYAVFAPLFSGVEGYRERFVQELDARYYGTLRYRRDAWSAEIRGQHQFGYGYVGVGLGHRIGDDLSVTGLFWPQYSQLGIEVAYERWVGTLALDRLSLSGAQALSFAVTYGY